MCVRAFRNFPVRQMNMQFPEKFSSLVEGAVERSETEGVKKVISNYKNSPSHFFLRKNDSPLGDGAETRMEFDIECGRQLIHSK